MKKIVTLVGVTGISFFAGAYWTRFKICQLVDAGVDVNAMAKRCMNKAEKEAEVRINKWRRKYSEVHHR